MITGFEFYSPEAWTDQSGLIVSLKPHSTQPHQGVAKRSGKWSIVVSNAVGGACLAISSFLLATPVTAEAVPIENVNFHQLNIISPELHRDVELSPTNEINQSFNKFFDSVRAGHTLIPSNNTRLLAQKALQSQSESVDIDSWALQLANDVKDAND